MLRLDFSLNPRARRITHDARALLTNSSSPWAGFETTAHTICWTLLLVASHPAVEARLLAELAGLGLAASPEHPRPGQMQWEHLAQVGT
jgi:hypothetical protein